MLRKGLLVVLIFLISINSIFAIGISPPKSIIYFEPNGVESVNFYVVNMGESESRVKIFFEGDLLDLITWDEQTVDLNPGEKKDFSFLGAVFYKFFLLGVIRMFDNTIS